MHVVRPARARYELDSELFTERGTVPTADLGVASRVAHRMNVGRNAARFPEMAVATGQLYAAGLIDEVLRLVVTIYQERHEPELLAKALAHLHTDLGAAPVEKLLRGFTDHFPAMAVARHEATVEQYLDAASDGRPHRQLTIGELLMLRVANENPGTVRFRELFDDDALAAVAPYEQAVRALEALLADLPAMEGPGGGMSLFELLRSPARHSPTSLEGQLRYIADQWAPLLGDRFAAIRNRLLRTLDVLTEERKSGALGFGPPPVLDAGALVGPGRQEYERYSLDSSWMPRLVLIAKSTYVWLDQLSRWYQRDIHRLDHIPDEELDRLAEGGFTGLWLIGLWERSEASRRIKHLRGDPDAVASAYALYDYVIAADLGGPEAYQQLRDRAWHRGIRLASDMVPNHVGIDGRWVIEHPHWFLSLPEPPYPGYAFTGEDLSPDARVTIQIEDHYWDGTDAAVVFKRYDHGSGETRFIYHGNDGTAMPWNDTAQLNYLDPEVREGVIQTILHVARQFPIIRFDAAMTLAKQHIQRLWFPAPGHGGAIPSRAAHGMTTAEFDRHMPEEFWREVVDRVAAEVPDTLLLAEAFWLMEGYFVRTLGMHRVYNSAFMHMLAAERNADYRQLVRNVLEFDPEVLKRFVNFMSNPDEETAVAQFGKDDKYFGVATVMATMPGLPMFGHGQVEGFTEKYGMEYRRPKWHEDPDQWLVDRHRREIFPLLHRREQFAHVDDFLLYDVVNADGHADQDVYAYSNWRDGAGSLVVFNNRYEQAAGRIHHSVQYRDRGAGALRSRPLHEALRLRAGEHDWAIYREHVSGLEYLRRSRDLTGGMWVELNGYEHRVYLDWREVADADGSHARLAERLGGAGVPSVADALRDLRLEPLHEAVAGVVTAAAAADFADALAPAVERLAAEAHALVLAAVLEAAPLVRPLTRAGDDAAFDADVAARLTPPAWRRALLAARAVRDGLPAHVPSGPAIRAGFVSAGLDGPSDALLALLARPFDAVPARGTRRPSPRLAARRLLASWADDGAVRAALGVNEHDGVLWYGREPYRDLVSGLTAVGLARAGRARERRRVAAIIGELAAAEDRSGYRWEKLAG